MRAIYLGTFHQNAARDTKAPTGALPVFHASNQDGTSLYHFRDRYPAGTRMVVVSPDSGRISGAGAVPFVPLPANGEHLFAVLGTPTPAEQFVGQIFDFKTGEIRPDGGP